jgi:putative chitinase
MAVRYKVKTSGAKLNLRDAPSTSGAIVDKLSNDQEVEVIDATRKDGWWRVASKGVIGPRIGYLTSQYLTPAVAYDSVIALEPALIDAMRAVSKAANANRLSGPTAQRIDQLAEQLRSQLAVYDMLSPLRIAHFLAQAGAETGGFIALAENLHYTTADALRRAFGNRFANYGRDPNDYLRNAEKLANFVYANRLGNGDEASGDGFRYRGRGLIQLTGRTNYSECARLTGEPIVDDPDRCADIIGSVTTALKYWNARGLQPFSGPSEMHARWLGAAVNVGWNPAGNAPRPKSHNEELRVKLFHAAIDSLAKSAGAATGEVAPPPVVAPAPVPEPAPAPPAAPAPEPAPPAAEQPAPAPAPEPAPEPAPSEPGVSPGAPSSPGAEAPAPAPAPAEPAPPVAVEPAPVEDAPAPAPPPEPPEVSGPSEAPPAPVAPPADEAAPAPSEPPAPER